MMSAIFCTASMLFAVIVPKASASIAWINSATIVIRSPVLFASVLIVPARPPTWPSLRSNPMLARNAFASAGVLNSSFSGRSSFDSSIAINSIVPGVALMNFPSPAGMRCTLARCASWEQPAVTRCGIFRLPCATGCCHARRARLPCE